MRWDVQPSQAEGRRTCSLGCAATLKRREQSGKRKGETNPNHRHGKRAGSRDRAGERRWYAALGRLCAGPCDSHLGRLALHHVVYRQTVIREGGDPWDPRNAFTICASGHARHHHRTRPIPLAALPDSAYEFAADLLGAEAAFNYLTRRYAGTDPRLDELLAGV